MRGLMKRYVRYFVVIALTLATGSVFALDTAALVDESAAVLLKKNCIRTDVGGVLPVRFDTAVGLLGQPDLLLYIQKEYPSSASEDGANNFPIIGTGNGAYHYINEKSERTDILELYRRQTSETSFDLVYLTKGKQSFGKYDVLIHIRVVDAEEAGTLYVAEIHTYPRHAALRFFARRFGSTESYFQRKTWLIAGTSIQLCRDLENHPSFIYQPAPNGGF